MGWGGEPPDVFAGMSCVGVCWPANGARTFRVHRMRHQAIARRRTAPATDPAITAAELPAHLKMSSVLPLMGEADDAHGYTRAVGMRPHEEC